MNTNLTVFVKAISDETRQEIMKHLCCAWLSVNDIVDKLGGKVKQPTVSHHLKELEAADLVTVIQDGRQRFYTLNRKRVSVCCHELVIHFAPDYVDSFEETSSRKSFPLPAFPLMYKRDRVKPVRGKIVRVVPTAVEPELYYRNRRKQLRGHSKSAHEILKNKR